jgi:hypothetical protein
MGAGFTGLAGGTVPCQGTDVIAELNDVFSDPTSNRYKYAKANNSFGDIPKAKDNYKLLIAAYAEAGVNICPGWGPYLRRLGRNNKGQQDIVDIAKTRDYALQNDLPIITSPPHDESDQPRGGVHVQKHDGKPKDPTDHTSLIDPPFPLGEHP